MHPQRALVTAAAAASGVACLLALGKGLGHGHGAEAPRGDRWGVQQQPHQQQAGAGADHPSIAPGAGAQAGPATCVATATGLYEGHSMVQPGAPSTLATVGRGIKHVLGLALSLLGA